MKKTISFWLFLLCFSFAARAQDPSGKRLLSLNTDLAFNLSSARLAAVELTPLVQAQFPVVKRFSMTAATGLTLAFTRSTYVNEVREAVGTTVGLALPLLIGGRYYFFEGLHTDLDLGVSVKLNQLAGTRFRFAPGLGYALPAGKNGFFKVSTHLVTGFKYASSSFNLRFGYMLPL